MVFDGQQINTQNQVSSLPRQFLDALSEILGRIEYVTEASGGSISRALVATAGARKWFVKLDETGLLDMFEAEADGLRALAKCPAIRVPQVIGTGCAGQQAYLILEHIELQPLRENGSSASAGRALADLHRIVGERFGWSRDNFIGSTPQSNRPHADWAEFFAQERLLPQLDLTRRHGHSGSLIDAGERLIERLHVFFSGDSPAPSLLHGDLWNGNAANDRHGKFVLYDPAVHFGDRETDLAMSELFGGFPAAFYAAYREAWPLSPGYPQRRKLYQLYHILNHFNLFGGGYRQQAEKMIRILLAEIG
jgi:fructosamine-3-kinase